MLRYFSFFSSSSLSPWLIKTNQLSLFRFSAAFILSLSTDFYSSPCWCCMRDLYTCQAFGNHVNPSLAWSRRGFFAARLFQSSLSLCAPPILIFYYWGNDELFVCHTLSVYFSQYFPVETGECSCVFFCAGPSCSTRIHCHETQIIYAKITLITMQIQVPIYIYFSHPVSYVYEYVCVTLTLTRYVNFDWQHLFHWTIACVDCARSNKPNHVVHIVFLVSIFTFFYLFVRVSI